MDLEALTNGISKGEFAQANARLAARGELRQSPPLADPFDLLAGEDAKAETDAGDKKGDLIHIRVQQRNGRKCITTVQGLDPQLDHKKIIKAIKKVLTTAPIPIGCTHGGAWNITAMRFPNPPLKETNAPPI